MACVALNGAALGFGDLDTEALTDRLSARVVGRRLFYHEVLGSTMDEARRLANDGAPEGAVVVAEEQTAGRGRFDRTWVSPRGQDILLSVILRPSADRLPYVNMAATLAVSEAIIEVTGLTPSVKWPNDVRIGGRKVSGILVESAVESGDLSHAVVGIGLNVNSDPSRVPEVATVATSLYRETGRRLDRTGVLGTVLERLDALYRAVKQGRSLTQQWAARLDTLGRNVRVQWRDRRFEGEARGVDEQGNLLLSQPDGSTVTVVAGEVTLQT